MRQKNLSETIQNFDFVKKLIICVQVTLSGKSNSYLCTNDVLLCAKAIFSFLKLLV